MDGVQQEDSVATATQESSPAPKDNGATTSNDTNIQDSNGTTTDATTTTPAPPDAVKRSHKRSSEFKPQELLLIARSWIHVTDARTARSNSSSTSHHPQSNFWNLVHSKYCKELQSICNNSEQQYPFRTQSTIQQKWSKYILPNVQKFMSIWSAMMNSLKIVDESISPEIVTGEGTCRQSEIIANAVENRDHETLYAIANSTFRVKYSKTTKDFSDYRLAWQFLRTKQKFLEYCDHIVSKAKVKAENSADGSSSARVPRFASMTVNAASMNNLIPGESAMKKRKLPRGSLPTRARANMGGTSDVFAQVNYVKSYVKSSITSWQTSQLNCDSSLQKKYNDLLLQQRIKELEYEQDVAQPSPSSQGTRFGNANGVPLSSVDMEGQMTDLKAFMQEAFVSWQTLMASQHCAPELQRKYHNLLLRQKIRELEKDNEKEGAAEQNHPSLQKKYNDLLIQQRIRELETEENSHRTTLATASASLDPVIPSVAGKSIDLEDEENDQGSVAGEDMTDIP